MAICLTESVRLYPCAHIGVVTTKVFKAGNSQAIRLPKALRLSGETVQIEKTGRGLLILDQTAELRPLKALRQLYGSCPQFPEVEPLEIRDE